MENQVTFQKNIWAFFLNCKSNLLKLERCLKLALYMSNVNIIHLSWAFCLEKGVKLSDLIFPI